MVETTKDKSYDVKVKVSFVVKCLTVLLWARFFVAFFYAAVLLDEEKLSLEKDYILITLKVLGLFFGLIAVFTYTSIENSLIYDGHQVGTLSFAHLDLAWFGYIFFWVCDAGTTREFLLVIGPQLLISLLLFVQLAQYFEQEPKSSEAGRSQVKATAPELDEVMLRHVESKMYPTLPELSKF